MSVNAAIAEPATVKGWCPGALRPMLTGDGMLLRVRARSGALSVAQVAAVARIARLYGNGHIDLTRRANLQIRGVSAEALADIWAVLSNCDLIDGDAEAEAVRNVMVNPLTGLDPAEVYDVRPVAAALEREIVNTPALRALPGKFGFVVDSGGVFPLDGERADIRLKAHRTASAGKIALGVDTAQATVWLGSIDLPSAHTAAVALAMEFLAASRGRGRMRDCGAAAIATFRHALALDAEAGLGIGSTTGPSPADRLGAVTAGGNVIAVGIGAPFGRIEADALRVLATISSDLDISEFRLSPWRALYVPVKGRGEAEALIAAADGCGLVTSARHPLMSIDACPGAPACKSGLIETRAIAAEVAEMMPLAGVSSIHVSGCAKGCSRSKSADLVLVGTPTGVGVITNGTAASPPSAIVAPHELACLPSRLKTGA